MSRLYDVRRKIRDVLLANGWTSDEVIIKRRTNIWNDVAVATAASKHGQCLVIGAAKGYPAKSARPGSRQIMLDLTVPITLLELPTVDPEQPETGEADEDDRWEAMCLLLQGETLGRKPLTQYEMAFQSFDDIEDDTYVIRQTIFTTWLLLKP